jgi:hypothetical protein
MRDIRFRLGIGLAPGEIRGSFILVKQIEMSPEFLKFIPHLSGILLMNASKQNARTADKPGDPIHMNLF